MLDAMRNAWSTDPTFFHPIIEAARFYDTDAVPDTLWQELDSLARQPDIPVRWCIRALLAQLDNRFEIGRPAADDDPDCVAFAAMQLDADQLDSATVSRLFNWAQRHPTSPALVYRVFEALTRLGAWDSILAYAERLTRPAQHPLVRAIGHTHLAPALHRVGRHEEAVRAERDVDTFLRASSPRVRSTVFGFAAMEHRSSVGDASDSSLAAHADAAHAAGRAWQLAVIRDGDPHVVLSTRMNLAREHLDAGDFARSLALWDTVVAQADSLRSPRAQAQVYMRRGRTRVKLGDWAGAERDLLVARVFARRQSNLASAYETEHNLLHLYEAQGRWRDAREAGNRFVTLTREGGLTPVRMMSHRDLAWFLLHRGERETARRHFEAMLADIESLPPYNEYPFYAGEYFAAIGDLDRAASYYRRSATTGVLDRTLPALSALAERTGDSESALRYARESDALPVTSYPEARPILPGLLARTGRVTEAVAAFARARATAKGRGQAATWARLSLELAEMELGRGTWSIAAALADSAAEGAGRVADQETALRARALAAAARARLHPGRGGAIASLESVVVQARRAGMPQLHADILLQYGDALAAAGRTERALVAFARAAELTDSIAGSLKHDPIRAGFRGATQVRVSNRALTAILAQPRDRSAPARFAAWSMRRKNRDLAGSAPQATPHVLSSLQLRLGGGTALLDYAVLDTAVAVLVVTDRAVTLARLPATADSVRAMIAALHAQVAPRLGPFVDRTRARFDHTIARALYAAIVEPIELLLGERRRLVIVPDAPLHLVPFDALVTSSPADAPAYLLDRYAVTLATTFAVSPDVEAGLGNGPVVAFAGPAAQGAGVGMTREVAEIAATVRERRVVRLDSAAATESALRALAGNAAVLHFAAHARPNAHQPDYGFVALAPGDADDGRLHVHEIRELTLPGSLVVLSACESATGRLAGGEGPLSLARAFLQAGASGVVGTLWPVGEPTTELMRLFYAGLSERRSPADALRAAKQSMLRGAHTSPLHWAGFTLVNRVGGDAETATVRSR